MPSSPPLRIFDESQAAEAQYIGVKSVGHLDIDAIFAAAGTADQHAQQLHDGSRRVKFTYVRKTQLHAAADFKKGKKKAADAGPPPCGSDRGEVAVHAYAQEVSMVADKIKGQQLPGYSLYREKVQDNGDGVAGKGRLIPTDFPGFCADLLKPKAAAGKTTGLVFGMTGTGGLFRGATRGTAVPERGPRPFWRVRADHNFAYEKRETLDFKAVATDVARVVRSFVGRKTKTVPPAVLVFLPTKDLAAKVGEAFPTSWQDLSSGEKSNPPHPFPARSPPHCYAAPTATDMDSVLRSDPLYENATTAVAPIVVFSCRGSTLHEGWDPPKTITAVMIFGEWYPSRSAANDHCYEDPLFSKKDRAVNISQAFGRARPRDNASALLLWMVHKSAPQLAADEKALWPSWAKIFEADSLAEVIESDCLAQEHLPSMAATTLADAPAGSAIAAAPSAGSSESVPLVHEGQQLCVGIAKVPETAANNKKPFFFIRPDSVRAVTIDRGGTRVVSVQQRGPLGVQPGGDIFCGSAALTDLKIKHGEKCAFVMKQGYDFSSPRPQANVYGVCRGLRWDITAICPKFWHGILFQIQIISTQQNQFDVKLHPPPAPSTLGAPLGGSGSAPAASAPPTTSLTSVVADSVPAAAAILPAAAAMSARSSPSSSHSAPAIVAADAPEVSPALHESPAGGGSAVAPEKLPSKKLRRGPKQEFQAAHFLTAKVLRQMKQQGSKLCCN